MTLTEILAQQAAELFSFDARHPLLFTQFNFWAFFALTFAVLTLLRRRLLLRNAYLFAVSLFFYYKTSGLFTLLLGFTVLFNYVAGLWLGSRRTERGRRGVLVVSLAVNLAALGYYKYAYFLCDMLSGLLGVRLRVFDVVAYVGNGLQASGYFSVEAILLPVGISFFTFQAISYVMDIYRRRVQPVRNVLDFGFYLSFFPQLVAGPIVRAKDFLPQLRKPFALSRRQMGMAMFWIVNGMAKKIVLSDYIAVNMIDRVFENPQLYSGFENLVGLFGYSLQVYADFSGYTDIAIGVALLMGFYLPQNFNSPYKATNPSLFWKRWHISLSRWLQDYLYIPLGGNRRASRGTYICILTIAVIGSWLSGSLWVSVAVVAVFAAMLVTAWRRPEKKKKITSNINRMNTMLLGGLWHGASWNFMIWGGLNGLGMVVWMFWRDWSAGQRAAVITLLTALFALLSRLTPAPVWNIAVVWSGVIWLGAVVRYAYKLLTPAKAQSSDGAPTGAGSAAPAGQGRFGSLEHAWSILLTFVFITFTRLFFRSGSNLDPAEANETAWRTARSMVQQIGSAWNVERIPAMCQAYWPVMTLIVLGMAIHWVPERTKRRYRMAFASQPLPVMTLSVSLIVFVLYQFITADLQKFIYFQF